MLASTVSLDFDNHLENVEVLLVSENSQYVDTIVFITEIEKCVFVPQSLLTVYLRLVSVA